MTEWEFKHVATENGFDEETNQPVCQVTLVGVMSPEDYAAFKQAFKTIGHGVRIRG